VSSGFATNMKIDVNPLSIHKQFILTESCEADKILSHVSVLMFTVQKVVLLLLQSCEHGTASYKIRNTLQCNSFV